MPETLMEHTCALLWFPPMSSRKMSGGQGLNAFAKLFLFCLSCSCSHLKSLSEMALNK